MPKQAQPDQTQVPLAKMGEGGLSGRRGGSTAEALDSVVFPQGLSRPLRATAVRARAWSRGLYLTDALLPLAPLLWIVALRGVRLDLMNDYGLLPALPYTFFLSLGVLTVSFVAVLAR